MSFGILLATFRFRYRRIRIPIIFMIWGFSYLSMTPKTNIIYLWKHQKTPNIDTQIPNHFPNHYCWKPQNVGTRKVGNNKKWGPKKLEDPSNGFLKILNMGSISPIKHELEFLNM